MPIDPFAHAESTADRWLAAVRIWLGTDNRVVAYRMLRAWLHVVRDRLPAEAAANFGTQLPVLLRGVVYEGWNPTYVPTRYGVPGFVARFAGSASINRAEVPDAAAAVTSALSELCAPGQLERVLKLMPDALSELLTADVRKRHAS